LKSWLAWWIHLDEAAISMAYLCVRGMAVSNRIELLRLLFNGFNDAKLELHVHEFGHAVDAEWDGAQNAEE